MNFREYDVEPRATSSGPMTEMKLRELRLFSRTAGGASLLPEAVRALNLPMPDDVLEQFILDHGLNDNFQARYGDLNLYSLAWSLEQLTTDDIIACTTKFDDYVREVSERHRVASSVECAVFHPDARISWSERGTWLRAPLFFREVLPPPDHHHLIEGHTRLGALLGFHRSLHPPVRLSVSHACWIGRVSRQPLTVDWRAVRRQYPLSFKRWIYDAIGQESPITPLAIALLDVEHGKRYEMSVGDELRDLIHLVERVPVVGLSVPKLKELHSQWAKEVGW